MKLIDDWKQSWKFLSVQLNALIGAVMMVYVLLPREDQIALLALLPGGEHNGAAFAVLILVVAQTIARLKAQPGLRE